jgi:hypothetical protein
MVLCKTLMSWVSWEWKCPTIFLFASSIFTFLSENQNKHICISWHLKWKRQLVGRRQKGDEPNFENSPDRSSVVFSSSDRSMWASRTRTFSRNMEKDRWVSKTTFRNQHQCKYLTIE